jgi:hypothetical protein
MDNDNDDDIMGGYILVNGIIKKVAFVELARWKIENPDAGRIDITHINDNIKVSTVFLGMDHNFWGCDVDNISTPILFETMVFGGKYDGRQRRYSTYGDAKKGHWEIVDGIRNDMPPEEVGEKSIFDHLLDLLGDDDNARCTKVKEGDLIICPTCREKHALTCGVDEETNEKTDLLMFYQCGDKSFLGAVCGHLVLRKKPDCSGQV